MVQTFPPCLTTFGNSVLAGLPLHHKSAFCAVALTAWLGYSSAIRRGCFPVVAKGAER